MFDRGAEAKYAACLARSGLSRAVAACRRRSWTRCEALLLGLVADDVVAHEVRVRAAALAGDFTRLRQEWGDGSWLAESNHGTQHWVKFRILYHKDKDFDVEERVLKDAAAGGCVELLQWVVSRMGAERLCWHKDACLRSAAQFGRVDMVTHLLGEGADLDAVEFIDRTPLICACAHGQLETARMMLQARLQAPPTDDVQEALRRAAQEGHTAVVRLLLDMGRADPNALEHASRGGYHDVVELLLAAGADPERQDDKGRRPLFFAANSNIARILVERCNVVVDARDQEGKTALMHAAEKRRQSTVRALLELGADVNAQGDDGKTALMRNAEIFWEGQHEIGTEGTARMLLEVGQADVHVRDNQGMTARDWANGTPLNRRPSLVALLDRHGAAR